MKCIPLLFLLTSFAMFVSAAAFAQGSMSDSTKKEGTPAEERTETPAQEKTEQKTKTHHTTTHHKMKMASVDINSASKDELMKISGMTEDMAEKIVQGRPYKSRAQLSSKAILTKEEYAKVRAHLMVKKATAAAASSK